MQPKPIPKIYSRCHLKCDCMPLLKLIEFFQMPIRCYELKIQYCHLFFFLNLKIMQTAAEHYLFARFTVIYKILRV